MVRASQAAIGTGEEHSVHRLLDTVPRAPPRKLELREYNFRTAQTKLQINALLALEPRDLRSGELFDGPPLIGRSGAEALPRIFTARLQGVRVSPVNEAPLREMMQRLANRLLHPTTDGLSLSWRHCAMSLRILSAF